jgi:hypothetical protein
MIEWYKLPCEYQVDGKLFQQFKPNWGNSIWTATCSICLACFLQSICAVCFINNKVIVRSRVLVFKSRLCLGAACNFKTTAYGLNFPLGILNNVWIQCNNTKANREWRIMWGKAILKYIANATDFPSINNPKPGLPDDRIIYRAMLSRSPIGSGNRGLPGEV